MSAKTPRLLVEYVENEVTGDFGWYCEGWVDSDTFFAACKRDAEIGLHFIEDDMPDWPAPERGYVRHAPNQNSSFISERPNGGRRCTFVWIRDHD